MISIHTIRTVAKFETRTLLRSWFFRIFAILSILGIGIFNIAAFVDASDSPWIFRALPAAIPYANLLILNLGQAIVAIFLASEFLKQDSKNDTAEVIYARSMTNSDYILGKTLGIISIFVLLNIIVLSIGIGFSFLSNESSQSILELLYYPLLISIPTLVFILGLAFFLMTILKNQAITFIILLGYIALTIFYLNTKFYHLFDYIAYKVPMMNSTIGGFGNLEEVIIHRGIYFFLGLGFIAFTIAKLNRLPQSKYLVSLPIYLALIGFSIGGGLTWKYLDLKIESENFRKEIISLNNKYATYPKVEVSNCEIDLNHLGNEIEASSKLRLINNSNSSIDTLIFNLNPSLKLISIQQDNKKLEFKRDLHLIKIIPQTKILEGDTLDVILKYKGEIDERLHFLDKNPKLVEDDYNLMLYRIRKRSSYLLNDFVCLTSDALWYPTAGVTYSSDNPAFYSPDFTKFKLKVQTKKQLTAVSQGKLLKSENGKFEFNPEYALPKISLQIGNYKQYSTTIDSIEYSIYSIKGNDFFTQHFDSIQGRLPELIRELKNEYETQLGLEYPFKRFALAEVPIQFSLDKHIWSIASEAVQPEIILYSEKGVLMSETDFKKRKKRFEKRMKRNNEEVSEDEVQARMFKKFVRSNFINPSSDRNSFRDVNSYSPFPNYFGFSSLLHSPENPLLNLALSVYLKGTKEENNRFRSWRMDEMSKTEQINIKLKQSSLKEITIQDIEQAERKRDQIYLNDIFQAKGNHFFSQIKARYGEDNFNSMVRDYVSNNRYRKFSFVEFDSLLSSKSGLSIRDELKTWYTTNQLPGFLVKDIESYKVKEGDHIKYQIRCKISNPEPVGGIVTVNVNLVNQNGRRNFRNQGAKKPDFSKTIYIPANSAREVGFVFPTQPQRMSIETHISQNLPNKLVYDFNSFSKTKKSKFFNEIRECEVFEGIIAANEIIVDNEDNGFEYVQVSNKSYLKRWVDSRRSSEEKYSRFRIWNPPSEWKNVLRSDFFGKYVHSAFVTKSGNGDRSASWKADIKKSGYYDVYCHIEKIKGFGRRSRQTGTDYNFKIHHESGVDEIRKSDSELEKGWNFLGTFFITPETSKVELVNKSEGPFVFADAIKWVENK